MGFKSIYIMNIYFLSNFCVMKLNPIVFVLTLKNVHKNEIYENFNANY